MLITCKECGHKVSDKADKCPSCGIKIVVKKSSTGSAVLSLAVLVSVIYFTAPSRDEGRNKEREMAQKSEVIASSEPSSVTPNPAPKEPVAETQSTTSFQDEFEKSRTDKLSVYDNAINQIQKSAVFNKANQDMESVLSKHGAQINRWTGRIERLSTDHGGETVSLHIKSSNNVVYKSFDDIEAGSSLYKQLSSLAEGQTVEFSGALVQRAINKTWEISETERGSLEEPEYFVDFTSVQSPIKEAMPEKSDNGDITPSQDVMLLMSEWEKFNDKCRGGSGDNPETWTACEKRDATYEKINAKNWCWGHEGQYGYQKMWEICK